MASIDVRERRQIGNTGIYVSPFGFGGSALGHIYGQIDVSVLSHCRLPDTKDTYSDTIQWHANDRSKVVLTPYWKL